VNREELRAAVRERARRRCEYCYLPDVLPKILRFHLEHIQARQHGGRTELANLAWCCQRCNERKGPNLSGVDPDTGSIVTLFHPRIDRWAEHFAWRDLQIQGLTEKGRATVWVLEVNSEEKLRWRATLQRHGFFHLSQEHGD
jgi:hypothetical protein